MRWYKLSIRNFFLHRNQLILLRHRLVCTLTCSLIRVWNVSEKSVCVTGRLFHRWLLSFYLVASVALSLPFFSPELSVCVCGRKMGGADSFVMLWPDFLPLLCFRGRHGTSWLWILLVKLTVLDNLSCPNISPWPLFRREKSASQDSLLIRWKLLTVLDNLSCPNISPWPLFRREKSASQDSLLIRWKLISQL